MTQKDATPLAAKHCVACDKLKEPCQPAEVQKQLAALPGWQLAADGKRIRKDWQVKDFLAGMEFFRQVAQLAESEGHHPDLHLEGYRHAWIELSTHAVGGLSENDFILAAKIDRLPVELKK
jgi:4a-hydroxytetrahydrobiopterin dehydratase